jgi:hypothetical protein
MLFEHEEDTDDQTTADCRARINMFQAEYGDLRDRGQVWDVELYQELLDGYVYALCLLHRLGGDHELYEPWRRISHRLWQMASDVRRLVRKREEGDMDGELGA